MFTAIACFTFVSTGSVNTRPGVFYEYSSDKANKLGIKRGVRRRCHHRGSLSLPAPAVVESRGKDLALDLFNPSTADAMEDDAMLRRLISFTKREGYSGLTVVNLFAYRSPYPGELKHVTNRRGEANDEYIRAAFAQSDAVVVAWGAFADLQGRNRVVLAFCKKPVLCLGTTRQGHPRHPCRLANSTPLEVYPSLMT